MLRKLVEDITEAVAAFERIPRVENTPFSILLLVSTAAASFSPSVYIAAAFFALGLLFAAAAREVKPWALVAFFSLFFSGLVSLPAALGLLPSRTDPLLFVARTVSAASVATGGLLLTGWWGFVRSLRLRGDLRRMFELMPLSVMAVGRAAVVIAAAKEARGEDKRAVAAAVGDVLIYGIQRGMSLRMAYEARSA